MIIGIVASQQAGVANATTWTYIGTSGADNEAWVPTGATPSSCRSSSTVRGLLSRAKPASNYPVGYIIRVVHTRTCNPAIEPCRVDGRGRPLPVNCTTYYYRAD